MNTSGQRDIELPTFSSEFSASVPSDPQVFEQFARVLERWKARYVKARAAAHYEERAFHRSGRISARRQGAHLLAANAIRVLDLGAGIIVLVNERRAHPAYAAARSLVETTASLSYLDQEVVPRLRKGRAEQVNETLQRLRVGLDPGATGDDPDLAIRPIPVSSIVKALARQVDAALVGDDEESAGETMSAFYSVLSDHAHPNHSAQHLSSSIDDEWIMDWSFDHAWTPSTIHDVLGTTYLALHFGGEAFDHVRDALVKYPLVLADRSRG